ncbi:MAG: ATP-binding cassette domain-containing protein, partial [Planctomycetaceae bacterium]|nr:ATP-binding cassette domain-containing protein [Planctomycetaceae bacterium]
MPFRLEAAACWEAPCAALFGASGSGKTTILEAFAGIRPECAGRVTIGGRDVSALPPEKRRVGWVPQDAALFPHLDTERNAAFGAGRWESSAWLSRPGSTLKHGLPAPGPFATQTAPVRDPATSPPDIHSEEFLHQLMRRQLRLSVA